MKRLVLFLAVSLAFCGIVGAAAAADRPMADGGLDQTVTVDTTVQLDATGSTYPSGDIASYRWKIDTPGGRRMTPNCADCSRTSFVPTTPGRYEVNLTVIGTDGARSSDTLYVYVNDAGPTVSVTGATTPKTTSPTEYVATAESPDAELEEIAWAVDDEIVGRQSLDGTAATDDLRISFPGEGPYRVQAVVVDTNGRTAYDDIVVYPGRESTPDTEWDDVDSGPSSPDCGDPDYLASNTDDCLSNESPPGGPPTPTPAAATTDAETPEPTPQPPKDEEIFYDSDGYDSTLRVGSRIADSSYLGTTTDAVGLDGGENAPWKQDLGEQIYEDTVGAASTFVFGQEQKTVTCETTGGEWSSCDEKIRQLEDEGGTTNAYSSSNGGAYHQYGLENAERIAGPDPTNLEKGQDANVTVVVQEGKDNIVERGIDVVKAVSDIGQSSTSGDESSDDAKPDSWSEPTTPVASGDGPSDGESSESATASSDLHSRLPETDLGGTDDDTAGGADDESEPTLPDDMGGPSGIGGGLVE
jgi:hypothetical protein